MNTKDEVLKYAPHIGANEAVFARRLLDMALERYTESSLLNFYEYNLNLSFAAGLVYRMGIIEGKRQERARRKRTTQHI